MLEIAEHQDRSHCIAICSTMEVSLIHAPIQNDIVILDADISLASNTLRAKASVRDESVYSPCPALLFTLPVG